MTRVLTLLVCVGWGTGWAEAEVLDALLARVDGQVVTWSEALQEAGLRELVGEPESLRELRVVREVLVRRRLLVAEAEKLRLEAVPAEVRDEVDQLVAGTGRADFWERAAELGLTRSDLEARARNLILVRMYLDLRREMTFVPESEVRSFYYEQLDVLGGRQLAEVRDEVRAYLAEKKYQKELDEWIDRQVLGGRVSLLEIPQTATAESRITE